MDWASERYVRLFIRDTLGWKLLPWQSKALLPLLLRKAHPTGRLDLEGQGVAGLAVIVELPIELVEVGLAGLVKDGSVALEGSTIAVRNFLAAQFTPSNARIRKGNQRDKEAVGSRHAPSRQRTERDRKSREVTPRLVMPQSSTSPVPDPDPEPTPRAKPARPPDARIEAAAALVTELRGIAYPPAQWDGARKQLRRGATGEDLLAYLRWANGRKWEGDEVQLDPSVLFRDGRFESGLAKARAGQHPGKPAPSSDPAFAYQLTSPRRP